MANANYWQRGEALDFPNAGESIIEANTIVIFGDRVGVAGTDIAPGEVGSVHVEGVFEFPKMDTTAIDMGASIFWDETTSSATKVAGTSPSDARLKIGFAAAPAAADDTTVLVKINA